MHLFSFCLDNAEETPYNDHGASVRFTRLNNILADQFPPEKVEKLKFLLKSKWLFLFSKVIYLLPSLLTTLNILLSKWLKCIFFIEKYIHKIKRYQKLLYFKKKYL